MISEHEPLRIAILGMIPDNGYPFSWSAMINGYAPDRMAVCPYPLIPNNLAAMQSRKNHGTLVEAVRQELFQVSSQGTQ